MLKLQTHKVTTRLNYCTFRTSNLRSSTGSHSVIRICNPKNAILWRSQLISMHENYPFHIVNKRPLATHRSYWSNSHINRTNQMIPAIRRQPYRNRRNHYYRNHTAKKTRCDTRRKNMQINQRDATLLMNDLYCPLIGCTRFGLSPVHHQEHHLIKCTTGVAVVWMYIHTTARLA